MSRKKRRKFRRHFRIYFVNNHPAYIVDEEGNEYVFHRATHSKTSGGKSNWIKNVNPLIGDSKTMYIVKKEQRDNKKRFSAFELELKEGVDVSYPEIKKAGNHQARSRSRYESSTNIKPKDSKKSK